MATQEIIIWECDLCKATAVPNPELTKSHALPKNWVELIMKSDAGYHFEIVICNGCSTEILGAMHRRNKE